MERSFVLNQKYEDKYNSRQRSGHNVIKRAQFRSGWVY